MASYLHDGTRFDLGRAYSDVTGLEWMWTGDYNAVGEPLMVNRTRGSEITRPDVVVSLPDLYAYHGPLIPLPQPITSRLMRHVFRQVA